MVMEEIKIVSTKATLPKSNGSLPSSNKKSSISLQKNDLLKQIHHNKARQIDHHAAVTLPLSSNMDSREERKANGRIIAVCVAAFLIFLGLYHAWIRRTAVLAGIIVPVLIMLFYTTWVLYSAKRHRQKMLLLQNATSFNSVNNLDKHSVSQNEVAKNRKPITSKHSSPKPQEHIHNSTTRYKRVDETSVKSSPKYDTIRKHENYSEKTLPVAPKMTAKPFPKRKVTRTPLNMEDHSLPRRFSSNQLMLNGTLKYDKYGIHPARHNKRAKTNMNNTVEIV
ncbi:uncharacterized protein LOC129763622 [Toxorhynchites rutilus septentrionalis]|uniref:uncharacterized protein LOC129763622 n=1 Tax=Toxorhynchites rutilus septentrionalis TaxID=329112 RepID=UPI00247B27C2|nr:uncharacterized protein LOC129763622 [Toxorhynchites rutilus septentrionalis]